MYKINTSTAVNKRFVDGNVSTQTPPTDLNAQWFNHIQGELVNAIEGLGGTVDGVNENSLFTAINNFKTAIEARAKSLEDFRTNRMGEIITTISDHKPLDCLACNGQLFRKSDFQDFVNYAVSKGYFETEDTRYNQAIVHGRWGKLFHRDNDPSSKFFYVPKLEDTFLRMEGASHRGLGTYQGDEFKSHYHFLANSNILNVTFGDGTNKVVVNPTGASNGYLVSQGRITNATIEDYAFLFNNTYPNVLRSSNTGGQETRPMNIAVRFWIRFK